MVRKVVLIDDDPDDIDFMVEAVRTVNGDAECLTFLNPSVAVGVLTKRLFIPELVIIDLTMPNLSGLDCFKQLKELYYHTNNVKFVMYSSAMPERELLDLLNPLGAIAFQKPSSIKALNVIMSSLMA
jgi:CheY-like chemotaxis protein